MRIISQDGMADLPYESIGICINYHNKTDIIAYPAGTYSPDDEYWILAHYSTEDKAKKAIEMLRDAYSPKFEVKEPVPKEMPKTRSSDLIWTVTQPKVEVLDNFYFQFPTDSKVEVSE